MMEKLLPAAMAAIALCAAQLTAAPLVAAQQAPLTGPNADVPTEIPSNQVTGVDIDRFIGDPYKAFMRVTNGGLNARSMLRSGDPYNPGAMGAVLEYRDDLSLATLEPHFETTVYDSPMIYFFYVQGGEGSVDSGPGTRSFKLHNGIGILAGPHVKQRFVNSGDKPLSMIMMSWLNNDGMTAPREIVTTDTLSEAFTPGRAHWVHMAKLLFDNKNGINTTMSAIYFPPMSYGGPHAHAKGVEEIWVKVGADEGYIILGSEIRKVAGTAAFLSPPNGKTYHSSMNLNPDSLSVWLYISRRAPGQTGPNPVSQGGGQPGQLAAPARAP
jgi:hypothetical protein